MELHQTEKEKKKLQKKGLN